MNFDKITLNQIREHHPCQEGWENLLKHLGKTKTDDTPVSLNTILESNGLDDALWCLRVLPVSLGMKRAIAGLKVSFVLPVKRLMKDARSVKAVEVELSFSKGEATEKELYAAAADAAAYAAADAAAAYAADADAAAAADAAAYAAAYAADAAAADATDATDARKKTKAKQKETFRSWVFGNEK